MASIFTSDDIATLVANFRPVSIREGRPLLVRSRSGNGLVNFEKLLSQFQDLLESGQSRIEKARVATLLGVEDGIEKIVYNHLDIQPYESKNGNFFIPNSELDRIFEAFNNKARESCVDLTAFASEQDINPESLQSVIQSRASGSFRYFSDRSRSFVCSNHVADSIKTRLQDAIGSSGTDICDLPAAVSSEVPLLVLRELANEVAAEIGGEIRLEGDHVVHVPANYTAAVEARLKQIRDERVTDLVQRLENQGYCVVLPEELEDSQATSGEGDQVVDLVLQTYAKEHPHDMNVQSITVFDSSSRATKSSQVKSDTTILVTPTALEQEMDTMRSIVSCHTAGVWRKGERSLSANAIIRSLNPDAFSAAQNSELARLLFRSDYVKELEAAVRRQLEDLEQQEQGKLAQLVEARLAIPLQLYSAGIDTIKDTTLRQHLEDFIADHFRREVIPQMIQAAQEQKLMREKAREKDMEKFKQICGDTTTFQTLKSAVSKLSKKLKLNTSSEGMVQKVRLRTLQAAVKSMQKMTRGSDVLQNLIWVLLAEKSGGMFISSGKDTSRMIKQYDAIAGPEIASMLTEWRDALKVGNETEEDLQKMRDMAKAAVENMTGPERKSSLSSTSPGRRKSSLSPERGRKSSSSAPPAEWQP